MTKTIIAWDLGATKCTAGIIEFNDADLICKKSFTVKLKQATSLENLIQQLELGLNINMSDADAICIGAAGYYDGEKLIHVNPYPYEMNFKLIAAEKKWPVFAVIHDYASIVCGTFSTMQNVKYLNHAPMHVHGRRVAFGIGTGLGLKDGVLFPQGDFWLGDNEAGHIGIVMPPDISALYLQRHNEIMQFLAKQNLPITFESLLTGKGTVNLFQFFYPHAGVVTPEEVGEKMRLKQADEMLNAFAFYIGVFVGTVQLMFMPEGGVWISGGVLKNHLEVFDRADFFDGIQASPAYLAKRAEFPLGVLCDPNHALLGCGYYAVKRLI